MVPEEHSDTSKQGKNIDFEMNKADTEIKDGDKNWISTEVDQDSEPQDNEDLLEAQPILVRRKSWFRVISVMIILALLLASVFGILSGGAFSRLFQSKAPLVSTDSTWQLSDLYSDVTSANDMVAALCAEVDYLEKDQIFPVVIPQSDYERIQRTAERLLVYATLKLDTALGDSEAKALNASVHALIKKVALLQGSEALNVEGMPSLYEISGIYEDIYDSFKFQYGVEFGGDPDLTSMNAGTRFNAYKKWVQSAKPSAEVMADIYEGKVKFNNYMARVFGETGALENFLWMDSFSMESFSLLQSQTTEALPLNHRWMTLKRRLLDLKGAIRYSDQAAPWPSEEERYTIDTGRLVVEAALKPLPEACLAVIRNAFEARWIDYYPREDKYNGAYTYGAYEVHPYLLLNFRGNTESLSELAHEMGHAIHLTLSAASQPFETYNGDVLISEMAAAVTELLYHEYQLKQADTEEQRLVALTHYIDFMSATYFDQMLATAFELKTHEMSESGQDLSAESLSVLWRSLTQTYYGNAYEITELDGYDWMHYQHLYWELYMYKYAVGIVAGYPLAMSIADGNQDALDAYERILSAGSSELGTELLFSEGIDFSTDENYKIFFERYRELLNELESLMDETM